MLRENLPANYTLQPMPWIAAANPALHRIAARSRFGTN